MKSVLITGGTGLIGRNLVGFIPFEVSYTHFPEHEELYDPILPNADIIIHAAGYGQPSKFLADPVKTIDVNTRITAMLLEKLNPGGTFLFCSSSEVYSGMAGLYMPAEEDEIGNTTPYHPRACYIEAKRCGEAIVNAYRQKGVNAMSARISLAYGPGTKKHDGRALNQFIEQALVKKKITLLDSGAAVRTYGYITDIVGSLWDIILKGKQPVYNVAGKSKTTIRELAEMIGKLTDVEVQAPSTSVDNGAPDEVSISLKRLEDEFGSKNYVDLQEGLKHTIAYQKELYGI